MTTFLNNCIARVRSHGLRPTIGFQFARTYSDWAGQISPHLGQFHYYDASPIPLVQGDAPAIIGEVATSPSPPFDSRVTSQLHN